MKLWFIYYTADDIDRQLWEIDENLIRSELSPSEQAEHLAKRKELWESRQSAQVASLESKRNTKNNLPRESRKRVADHQTLIPKRILPL